jgi:uncharacterized membrane protein YbhN (UPF0104 family)
MTASSSPSNTNQAGWWHPAWLRALGLVLFAGVLWTIDRAALARAYLQADWLLLSLGLALVGVHFLMRSWRWQLIAASYGAVLTWRQNLLEMGRAYFYGSLTPGRLGEAVRVGKVCALSGTVSAGIMALLWERSLDVAMIALIVAAYGLWIEWRPLAWAGFVLLGALISLAAAAAGSRKRWPGLHERLNERCGLASSGQCPAQMGSRARMAAAAAFTVLCWGLYGLIIKFLAASINLRAFAYADVLFLVAAASLIAMIPVTVAGLGTRELLLIELGRLRGVDSDVSVAFSLLFLLVYLMNLAIGCGITYGKDLYDLVATR